MGLNLAGGFGQFANALIQKIKQALEYLNNEPDHAGRGTVGEQKSATAYSSSYSSSSSDSDARGAEASQNYQNRSLLRVVLYWLYNCYFQPLDDDNSRDKQKRDSISLIHSRKNIIAVESLSNALKVDEERWLQVGHIQLAEVLDTIFATQGWDMEELKGASVLFQLKVKCVGVNYSATDPYSRLLFQYQPDTFKLSPYLFLFSPKYLQGRKGSANLTIDAILQHKEFCESKNLELEEYRANAKLDKAVFTLRRLYELINESLYELGWEKVIKLEDHPGANDQYIVDFYKVDESDQVLNRDFYFDDLNFIFQESLRNPGYSGVLLPMAHALFDPAIAAESWYSDEHLRQWLSLDRYSSARWPSPYSPALMQQIAVNLATKASTPKKQPVFSVNGPPGTGKTTLLKDIIAQKVFERAKLIADMNGYCFEKAIRFRAEIGNDTKHFTINPLKPEFRACNILVASCNNAAVENLTRELPDRANMEKPEDLKGGMPMDVDYFSERATKLLQTLRGDASEAWGLIAVPLGKRQNIDVFLETCMDDLWVELKETGGDNPLGKLRQIIQAFNKQVDEVESLRMSLRKKGGNLEDVSSDKAQIGNPYHDEAFNRARERLFYASLAVLKQFNALPAMRSNVMATLFYLRKRKLKVSKLYYEKSDELENVEFLLRDYAPYAFDTLFSLVPVISTTFASVGAMFADLKDPGRLGCLIVDEAGQAAPYMAAGALWRASQTIVVGDPKQVEPVVKTDAIVKRYIRGLLHLMDVEFLHEEISLQTMADVTNPYGGYIGECIPRNWVGCPLRVHRRCCEPMFSISNRTSYNGTMILGGDAVLSPKKAAEMLLPKSGWWNVSGKVEQGNHYVEAQGQAAFELVQEWMAHWLGADEQSRQKLFVISPFKSVVRAFKRKVNGYLKTQPKWKESFGGWASSCVGTVHTFQGKEAEEVIFLLGCDRSKVSSAQWVNSNILNVAVTRAKCRVYFIGDWAVWEQNKVFAKNIVFDPADSEGEPLVKFSSWDELLELLEPKLTDEELQDRLGVTPYLKWSVLSCGETEEDDVFIQDRERGWIFRIRFKEWGDFPLEPYRICWCYISQMDMSATCALVYPLRVDADQETIEQALQEACLFYDNYLHVVMYE